MQNLEQHLPPSARVFFVAFSRFEYALKRAGYLVRSSGAAAPSWRKLAAKLGDKFLKQVIDEKLAQTLVASPPKEQIVQGQTLAWSEVSSVRNCRELFEAMCRARNNLFHGGKFAQGPLDGTERSEILLKECMAIMMLALEKEERLYGFFTEPS